MSVAESPTSEATPCSSYPSKNVSPSTTFQSPILVARHGETIHLAYRRVGGSFFNLLRESSLCLIGYSARLCFQRFLFPRVTRTALARLALKQHQISLLSKLRESLGVLRDKQAETFAVLPKTPPPQEDRKYKDIHDLEGLGVSSESPIDVPEYTVLRCAIESLNAQKKLTTKEEIFSVLESQYPWLTTEKGIEIEVCPNLLCYFTFADYFLKDLTLGNAQQQSGLHRSRGWRSAYLDVQESTTSRCRAFTVSELCDFLEEFTALETFARESVSAYIGHPHRVHWIYHDANISDVNLVTALAGDFWVERAFGCTAGGS